jgi:hypothetical protein
MLIYQNNLKDYKILIFFKIFLKYKNKHILHSLFYVKNKLVRCVV